MCPNDNAPLLPSRCDSLYDSEAGCDVIFIVGPDKERVPGHRDVLANANPVFKAMLHGPLATSLPIHVDDIDGRAFDQLKRFLYKEDVQIQSVTTALLTLYAGHKYICYDLVELCIIYLDDNINVANVLEIYNYIRPYTQQSWAPSAPPLNDNDPTPTVPKPLPSCDALLHNVLQFIDNHADEVLSQEYTEDLDLDGLKCILVRDSLRVSSELVVFEALNKWCNRECKRRQMELTSEKRKMVLGEDALFLVRYLLMTSEDFLTGPMQSDLLEQSDSAIIISHILKVNTDVSKKLEDILPLLKRPRIGDDVGVVPLSSRTRLRDVSMVKVEGKVKGSKKKGGEKGEKKDKKRKSSSPSPERERRGAGTKFLECLVGVVSCVFD